MIPRVVAWIAISSTGCGGQAPPANGPRPDSWVAVSTVGAPVGRQDHTAVWTGTEMLVWGGLGENPAPAHDQDLHVLLDDGGRYDPVEDRWAAMGRSGAPSPRAGEAAAWAGSKLFVWGGGPYDSGEAGPPSPPFGDGALYDPVTDAWSTVSSDGAPEARIAAESVWTGAEVLVWGGYTWEGEVSRRLATGARYDPEADRWTSTATEGAPLFDRPFAVWTDHVMLVFDYISQPPDRGGALYDPSTDTWSPMTSVGMPDGHLCGPVWTGTELVVFDSDDSALARYDPARDEWGRSETAEQLCGVIGPVWTGEEALYWGPGSSPPGPRLQLDPRSGLATAMSQRNEPSPRTSHTAVWTGTVMIVWGGHEDGGGDYTNTGGRYTP